MSMREEIIRKMYERMAEDLSDTRTKRTWMKQVTPMTEIFQQR